MYILYICIYVLYTYIYIYRQYIYKYIYVYSFTALRRCAAPSSYKLFTLHPQFADIIPKACVCADSAPTRRAHARMHAHCLEHFVRAGISRECRFSTRYTFNRIAPSNMVGRRKSAGVSPEGGENSLKIPNVYSYNLHVIISDTPAGRLVGACMCVRADILTRTRAYV